MAAVTVKDDLELYIKEIINIRIDIDKQYRTNEDTADAHNKFKYHFFYQALVLHMFFMATLSKYIL